VHLVILTYFPSLIKFELTQPLLLILLETSSHVILFSMSLFPSRELEIGLCLDLLYFVGPFYLYSNLVLLIHYFGSENNSVCKVNGIW